MSGGMNVGAIYATFDGDSSRLVAAQDKLRSAIGGTSKVLDGLRAKLGGVSSSADRTGDTTARAGNNAARGAAGFGKVTEAAERASSKLDSLRGAADRVDDRMGKLQTAIGGVSSAFGAAGGRIGDAVGAIADTAMVFAAGGPLLAGIAVVTAGIAAIGKAWEDSAVAAKEAAKESIAAISAQVDELKKVNSALVDSKKNKEIDAFVTGLNGAQEAAVRGYLAVGDALEKLRAFEREYGLVPANMNSVIAGNQAMTRDSTRVPQTVLTGALGDPTFNLFVDKLAEVYSQLQDSVRNTKGDAAAGVSAGSANDSLTGEPEHLRIAMIDEANDQASRNLVSALGENAAKLQVFGLNTAALVVAVRERGQLDPVTSSVIGDRAWEGESMPLLPQEGDRFAQWGMRDQNFGQLTSTTFELTSAIGEAGYKMRNFVSEATTSFGTASDAASELAAQLAAAKKASFDKLVGDAATQAASGNLAGAGSMLGSAAGTVVGAVVAPGVGGAIGGGLGAAVGSLLGGLLEELIEVLGVLTPAFDALAIIVAALSPIFLVVRELMGAIGSTIIALVPVLVALVEPIAALLLVAVRIVEALLPFVNILLIGVSVLIAFLEVLTVGVSWLDEHFFRPLLEGVAWVYNGFIDFWNTIVSFIRNIEIAGVKPFEGFGIIMDKMSTDFGDILGQSAKSLDDLRQATDENTESQKAASSTNIANGYRVPYYEAEGARRTNGATGGMVFNGAVTFVVDDRGGGNILDRMRRAAMQQTGVAYRPRSSDDDDN